MQSKLRNKIMKQLSPYQYCINEKNKLYKRAFIAANSSNLTSPIITPPLSSRQNDSF